MPSQLWKALKNVGRVPEVLRCTRETAQWARVTTAYLGLSRFAYPCILRLRLGERIPLEEHTDLKTFWQVFLRRVYSVQPADRVILDVGANIGLFTLYAARCASQARIFALEPFPATFARLLTTVRDHHLEARVTCLNYAATGTTGIRVMPDLNVPSQRRSLSSSAKALSGTQVSGETLEQILDENALQHVDLLKMDIEGSEYEVLLSTPKKTLAQIDRIALEYHGDSSPYSKEQVFQHLGQAGFRVIWDVCDDLGYGVAEMIRKN
jgi:FkbM family methyltransferase